MFAPFPDEDDDGGGGSGTQPYSKGANWDGLGVALNLNVEIVRCSPCPTDGIITSATIESDVVGSCTIEVWKTTYAGAPATNANKISASAPITLTSAQKNQDTTLTGWSTSVVAGDIICFCLTSTSTIGWVGASVEVTPS